MLIDRFFFYYFHFLKSEVDLFLIQKIPSASSHLNLTFFCASAVFGTAVIITYFLIKQFYFDAEIKPKGWPETKKGGLEIGMYLHQMFARSHLHRVLFY